MALEAGRLRDRVEIERPVNRDTPSGATEVGWEPLKSVWAEVVTMSTQEMMQAQQSQFQVTHRVTMRYCKELDNTMRIGWRGRRLEILAVQDSENRTIHELVCREVTLS